VAKLGEGLASVRALSSAGRCDEAKKIGAPVKREAEQLRYRPAEAEISLALGALFDSCLDTGEAIEDLEQAIMAAEASRHDEVAVEASALLASAYGDRLHDLRPARQWIRHAQAILARLPGRPLLEARVAMSNAVILDAEGRFEEAMQENGRALATYTSVLGPSSLDVAGALGNVALYLHELGRDTEAAVTIHRSITMFIDVAGENTAHLVLDLMNQCEILASLGQYKAADTAITKALEIRKQQGITSFLLGAELICRGKLQIAQGHAKAAVATLEQSLAALGDQDPRHAAEARFALARALLISTPAAHDRAFALARTTREAMTKQPSAARLVREIDAWQDAARARR